MTTLADLAHSDGGGGGGGGGAPPSSVLEEEDNMHVDVQNQAVRGGATSCSGHAEEGRHVDDDELVLLHLDDTIANLLAAQRNIGACSYKICNLDTPSPTLVLSTATGSTHTFHGVWDAPLGSMLVVPGEAAQGRHEAPAVACCQHRIVFSASS